MSSSASKLLAITHLRSTIGRPNRKAAELTLKVLGITRVRATQIHKNAPTINAMAQSVLNLVQATPVVFRPDKIPTQHNAVTFLNGKKAFVNAAFEVEGVSEEEFLVGMRELLEAARSNFEAIETETEEGSTAPQTR